MRIKIGNFPPNSKATLTVLMYSQLEEELGDYSFKLPLKYIPKYVSKKEIQEGKNLDIL